jgi:hypothetical protein
VVVTNTDMASIVAGINGSFSSFTGVPTSVVVSALAAAAADMEGSSESHGHMNVSVDVDDVDGVEIESQQQGPQPQMLTRAPCDAFTSSDTDSPKFHVLDSDDSEEDEGDAVAAPNVAVDTTTTHDHDTPNRDTPGVHTQGSPFACHRKDCDENPSRANILKKRKRMGEKPFACKWEGCGYRAAKQSNFQQHKRTHTGEKSFEKPFASAKSAHIIGGRGGRRCCRRWVWRGRELELNQAGRH